MVIDIRLYPSGYIVDVKDFSLLAILSQCSRIIGCVIEQQKKII